MKVILVEDIQSLGKAGDTLEVKDGFARNYLFPKSLAYVATQANLNIIEKKKQKKQAQLEKEKEEALMVAKRIATLSCTIAMPAGEDEKLFGAVTTSDIANALKEKGIGINKKDIVISDSINKLGIYNINIKLHRDVAQELKVWVIKK